MIDHDSVLLKFAYQRQQEMFKQAETERLYKQLKGNRPCLLRRVCRLLAGALWPIKVRHPSNSTAPVLGHK